MSSKNNHDKSYGSLLLPFTLATSQKRDVDILLAIDQLLREDSSIVGSASRFAKLTRQNHVYRYQFKPGISVKDTLKTVNKALERPGTRNEIGCLSIFPYVLLAASVLAI